MKAIEDPFAMLRRMPEVTEVVYVSRDPERVREPVTIERLAAAPLILYDARWGADDPTRRLLRERAQRAGVKLEPQIEVEYMTAALDLAEQEAEVRPHGGDVAANGGRRRPVPWFPGWRAWGSLGHRHSRHRCRSAWRWV